MPYYTRHVRGPDTVHSFRSESNKLFLEDHVQTEIIRPAFDFFRNLNDQQLLQPRVQASHTSSETR